MSCHEHYFLVRKHALHLDIIVFSRLQSIVFTKQKNYEIHIPTLTFSFTFLCYQQTPGWSFSSEKPSTQKQQLFSVDVLSMYGCKIFICVSSFGKFL
jgi:hypothetical protein